MKEEACGNGGLSIPVSNAGLALTVNLSFSTAGHYNTPSFML